MVYMCPEGADEAYACTEVSLLSPSVSKDNELRRILIFRTRAASAVTVKSNS